MQGHADQYVCTCPDRLFCIYVKSNILLENDWIGTNYITKTGYINENIDSAWQIIIMC